MRTDAFALRHLGPRNSDLNHMFKTVGVESLDQLIFETIPDDIRLKNDLNLDAPMTEYEYLTHIQELGKKNKVFKSYIGLGYHPAIVPAVIQRNIFENPGWYTAYTPYQAEIAQGRLEAILNFQTTVIELTGMEIANASLLDEGTAAAEALKLSHKSIGERIGTEFGNTCAKIGILIAMAAIIGKSMLDSGAAERIIRAMLKVTGEKHSAIGFILSSFFLTIPVFVDTVIFLMMPLAKAMSMRIGKNYLLTLKDLILKIVCSIKC